MDLTAISRVNNAKRAGFAFVAGGKVSAELLPGETFEFVGDGVEAHDELSQSWLGHSRDEEGFLVLTARGGRLVGQASIGARRFKLHGAIDGRVVIREEFPEVGGDCANEFDVAADIAASSDAELGSDRVDAKALPVSSRTLDVLVTFSDEAQAHLGNNFLASIDNLAATMVQSFSAAGLSGGVRIVGYRRVAASNGLDGASQVSTDLDELHASTAPFTSLSTWRNDLGADVVVHLIHLGTSAGACGISRTRVTGSTANGVFGAVVGVNCPTSQHVFTHEIGHLLGGQHSTHFDGVDPPFTNNATFFGALLWRASLGYTQPSENGFRTLMGNGTGGSTVCTFASGCPRINRWSSPTQSSLLNGTTQPLGFSYVDPLGTPRTTNMVQTLGGYFDPVMGIAWSGSIVLVAANRAPNTSIPAAVTGLSVSNCVGTLNADWVGPGGAVGWYEWGRTSTPLSTVPNFLPTGRTATPNALMSVGSQSSYFHVAACNSAGCSAYQSVGPIYYSTSCL